MKGTTMRRVILAATALAVLAAWPAAAEVRTRTIEYRDGDIVLTGVLAWDPSAPGKRPGVLVVHEWWGLNDFAKDRAAQLAAEGYVAFALDMYGDRRVTEHAQQASEWMKQITADIELWTRRAQLGLEAMKAQDEVDADRVAAIGYCFGGATVMQMAYAGADVKAVVSFHGSLPPAPEGVARIGPRVLVAHGRDDPFIPRERIAGFQDSLDRAGAEWEMTIYSGAQHSFTNPGAGDHGMKGVAYDAAADARSWSAMMRLFEEVF
ncbi:MAG: dienelactone hydrolase family protein [Rhodospirillales bacterium]